jgi:hypothetical protein
MKQVCGTQRPRHPGFLADRVRHPPVLATLTQITFAVVCFRHHNRDVLSESLKMTKEHENSTNPAARLLDIFNKAKPVTGGTAAQAFAKIFDIDSNNTSELYRRLSECEQTARQLAELAGSITNPKFEKSFKENIDSIVQFFSPRNLDENWERHKTKILDRDTTALQLCSDLVDSRFQEQSVEKATLDDLSKKVDDLYAQVRTSDLDDVLKGTMLNGLQAIRTAIHNYTVRGVEGLQEALATAVGQYMIFNLYANVQRDNSSEDKAGNDQKIPDKKSEIAKTYLTIVSLLGNIVTMAYHTAPKLAEYIHRLLPPPK